MTDPFVEAEIARLVCRGCSEGLNSLESFVVGRRWDESGMLTSFELRSLRIPTLLSVPALDGRILLTGSGMRLPGPFPLGVLLFSLGFRGGSWAEGEASDPAWEGQSSERESSQAGAMSV